MSKQVLVWVVGEPGAGKTTLCRGLVGEVSYLCPSPKWTVAASGMVAAGHYSGGTFDGADTVPYNGVGAALDHWKRSLGDASITLLDGDRFSNARVRRWYADNAPEVQQLCLLIATDSVTCAMRRVTRGSNQNAAWVKGRATKAQRFWGTFETSQRLRLFEGSPEELLAATRRWLGLLD